MIAYFDASSFATLFLEDPGFQTLERWLDTTASQAVSDFGWGEFVSATSLRMRSNSLTEAAATAVITKALLYAETCSRIRVRSIDIARATELVARFDLKLKLPDALHIAIAQRLGATLVTSDTRQGDAATKIGLEVHNHLRGASA